MILSSINSLVICTTVEMYNLFYKVKVTVSIHVKSQVFFIKNGSTVYVALDDMSKYTHPSHVKKHAALNYSISL